MAMRFMVQGTWEPEQRDGIYKQRLEKGRMLPDTIKVVSEWMDIAGGRQWLLMEADDPIACFMWANHWSNLGSYESVPVVEVQDDKATKIA
jgi:Protein of unknown function (DUF3303)